MWMWMSLMTAASSRQMTVCPGRRQPCLRCLWRPVCQPRSQRPHLFQTCWTCSPRLSRARRMSCCSSRSSALSTVGSSASNTLLSRAVGHTVRHGRPFSAPLGVWQRDDSLARHSTCGRSVFPRDICRNCVMKTMAPRPPTRATHLPSGHAHCAVLHRCAAPLRDEASEATETQVALYLQHAPKTSTSRKHGRCGWQSCQSDQA